MDVKVNLVTLDEKWIKGETVYTYTCNPDAPRFDVPSLFYGNGYRAGIKAASDLLVRKSKAYGRMSKFKNNGEKWCETYTKRAFTFAKLGTEIRNLLKK